MLGDDPGPVTAAAQRFLDAFLDRDPALGQAPWTVEPDPDAAATCLAHGRDELALPEVVALTNVGNHRSRAVMTRLGMVPDPDADFDHPRVPDGDPRLRHVVFRTNW